MLEYRFYFIKHDGQIDGPAQDYEAADDRAALVKAKQLVDGHDIEVWQAKRLVAYVTPDKK